MCAEQASEILREQSGSGPGADWLLGRLGRMQYVVTRIDNRS